MEKAERLKTQHQVQRRWLDNQIAEIANGEAKSFSNADVAESASDRMKKDTLITTDSDIEHFVSAPSLKLASEN